MYKLHNSLPRCVSSLFNHTLWPGEGLCFEIYYMYTWYKSHEYRLENLIIAFIIYRYPTWYTMKSKIEFMFPRYRWVWRERMTMMTHPRRNRLVPSSWNTTARKRSLADSSQWVIKDDWPVAVWIVNSLCRHISGQDHWRISSPGNLAYKRSKHNNCTMSVWHR